MPQAATSGSLSLCPPSLVQRYPIFSKAATSGSWSFGLSFDEDEEEEEEEEEEEKEGKEEEEEEQEEAEEEEKHLRQAETSGSLSLRPPSVIQRYPNHF